MLRFQSTSCHQAGHHSQQPCCPYLSGGLSTPSLFTGFCQFSLMAKLSSSSLSNIVENCRFYILGIPCEYVTRYPFSFLPKDAPGLKPLTKGTLILSTTIKNLTLFVCTPLYLRILNHYYFLILT